MGDITSKFAVKTGLLSHHFMGQMVLLAEMHGLEVEHKHDGGWFKRTHVISVTGAPRNIGDYLNAVATAVQMSRRIPYDVRRL